MPFDLAPLHRQQDIDAALVAAHDLELRADLAPQELQIVEQRAARRVATHDGLALERVVERLGLGALKVAHTRVETLALPR